jgi:hypothetical protein
MTAEKHDHLVSGGPGKGFEQVHGRRWIRK